MRTSRITISIDRKLLAEADGLVKAGAFANRSQVIQTAVIEKLQKLRRTRLAEECAKLDPHLEQAMADGSLQEGNDYGNL